MPALVDSDSPAHTETKRRGRFRLPWRRTRVSSPTNDDELLVDNTTTREWALHLGYRDLGVISSHDKRLYHVVKSGALTARRVDAPLGDHYLILHIPPKTHRVQILDISGGEGFCELRCADG